MVLMMRAVCVSESQWLHLGTVANESKAKAQNNGESSRVGFRNARPKPTTTVGHKPDWHPDPPPPPRGIWKCKAKAKDNGESSRVEFRNARPRPTTTVSH